MEKRDERKSPAVGLRNFSFLYCLFYVPESLLLPGAGGGSPPSPSHIAGGRWPEGKRRRYRKVPSSRKARFGKGGGSLRGEGNPFTRKLKGVPSPLNISTINLCYCPAGGRRESAKGAGSLLYYLFFFPESLLLPGAGSGSPPRRGAGGERGRSPSTPPTPPYSPQSGYAKRVLSGKQSPARRAAQGASARTFPPLRAGRCPRLLRRSVRPPASGIAFAPAPCCIIGGNEERPSLGREQRGKTNGRGWDGEKEKKTTPTGPK